MARLQGNLSALSLKFHDSADVKLAMQAAHQAAERTGQDMAIQQDLSVVPFSQAKEPPLEIVRCPPALRRATRPVIYRNKT